LFIHGFNVSFEDAAYRTAQIAYDLRFDGVAMMYSWPSAGSAQDYLHDEATIDQSAEYLAQFLAGVHAKSGAAHIHVIVHSMGNRAMLEAMQILKLQQTAPGAIIDQVVFAAPDVDADTFAQSLHRCGDIARHCTLYGSSDDEAIKASEKIHGFNRAGEGGARLLLTTGVDSIDASGVDTSLLGHSYIGECVNVIDDIQLLIAGTPPPRRLYSHARQGLPYWTFN